MNLSDKISKHLIYHDVIKSETAARHSLDNNCPKELMPNATYWAKNVFDPIKDKFPACGLYSFYRGKALNSLVGGSPNSFHCFAGAGDIDSPANSLNKAIFKFVIDGGVPYNEVIWEYGSLSACDWVHVGLLPGYKMKKIIHIYHDVNKIKKREELSVEAAYERFKL